MNYSNVMPIAQRPDICFVKGQGTWLYDDQENAYLDFMPELTITRQEIDHMLTILGQVLAAD